MRRERTNTPMGALVLMNDPQFVEAARHLARRMMIEGGDSPEERVSFGFRLVTARSPGERETAALKELYRSRLSAFRGSPGSAVKLLQVGDSPRDEALDADEHAAWTLVANVLLNLDETITKG